MSRLPSLSSRKIIQALIRAEFKEAPDRGRGSHRAFVKAVPGLPTRLVIVPYGKDIPRGTLLSILEQAGLPRDEFLGLL